MSLWQLHLVRQREAVRPAVAWYLAGNEPAAWLAELAGWRIPQDQLRLFVVPCVGDRRIAEGLLVIPPAGTIPAGRTRALALGVIGGRLYLPIDAELSPPVDDSEIKQLCGAAVTLFHPGLGVIAFAQEEGRAVWDLLERPALAENLWNEARPGVGLSSRLLGVALLALPESEDLFGQAAEEIGNQSIEKTPKRPGEPGSGVGGALQRAAKRLGAHLAGALGKFFSASGGMGQSGASASGRAAGKGPHWAARLLDWAAAKLTQVTSEMEESRNQELHRLMALLQSNPDEGLRFALPLGGGMSGRGRVAPGSRLGPRDPRFNLGRLGGGGPSDPWSLSAKMRAQLTMRYRALAQREKGLGRFQRAAYIYAELLGDLPAAAAVLKEGRHFAEAAVLFRDHLKQPLAAAECFVAGGLFGEAVAIYAKEKRNLELGDLHRQLGQEEEAAAAFRRAVEEKIAGVDFIGAAELLENRLRVPDEALALLRNGWPNSPQAMNCLSAEFALLGRLGRHEAAHQRVIALREEKLPFRAIAAAGVLGSLGKSYPDAALRPLAADVARLKIGERLLEGTADDARAGLRILSELTPEDRLLARDTSRFLSERLDALARQTPPPFLLPARKPGSTQLGPPQTSRRFAFAKFTAIRAVKRCGSGFVAVLRRTLTEVVRGDWESGFELGKGELGIQSMVWSADDVSGVHLVLDQLSSQPDAVVPFTGHTAMERKRLLMPTDRFRRSLQIGPPDWLPQWTIVLSISGSQWWALRIESEGYLYETWSSDGRLLASFNLSEYLEENSMRSPTGEMHLLAMQTQAWIGFDDQLLAFDGATPTTIITLESPLRGLESSAPFLPRAVVARCASGVAVFWGNKIVEESEMLASYLVEPLATFIGNGCLVVLSSMAGPAGFAGQVIDLDWRRIHGTVDFVWTGGAPVAVVGTDRPNEFAIFTRDGEVQMFVVPTQGAQRS